MIEFDSEATDRGVSEIVGFILVFSLMIGTVAIVYTSGFAALQETRDTERINNAERAFDVLADNFQKLARDEAPNRATEIKLAGSQLSTGDARRISVNTSSLDFAAAADRNRAITYDAGTGSQVVYEHGAVIRVDGDNSVMKREPDFLISEDRTVIRFIETGGGSQSVGGDSTVLVRSSVVRSELLHTETNPGVVMIRLRTSEERADAWERYLNDEVPSNVVAEGNDPCDQITDADGVPAVECEFETDSLHVALTRVSVDFE